MVIAEVPTGVLAQHHHKTGPEQNRQTKKQQLPAVQEGTGWGRHRAGNLLFSKVLTQLLTGAQGGLGQPKSGSTTMFLRNCRVQARQEWPRANSRGVGLFGLRAISRAFRQALFRS